jgi:hypothetical protein
MSQTPPLLYVAWQDPETRRILPVARVALDAQGWQEFAYIHGAEEAEQYGFLPLLSFPDMRQVYRSREPLPLLQNRLLQRNRPDYDEYLQQLGLDTLSAEPFTVLGRSGGRRATDQLELFSPPNRTEDGRLSCMLFARGVRHMPGADTAIATLKPGAVLRVVPETENRFNPKALKLRHEETCLGYLPDYLASELTCDPEAIEVTVRKVNLPPASTHQRMLLQVVFPSADPPPFSGERYKPLSDNATQVAA